MSAGFIGVYLAILVGAALVFEAAVRGWIALPEGGQYMRRPRTPREALAGLLALAREPLVLAVGVGLVVGVVALAIGVPVPGPVGLGIALVLAALALRAADADRRRGLLAWAAALAVASLLTLPLLRRPAATTAQPPRAAQTQPAPPTQPVPMPQSPQGQAQPGEAAPVPDLSLALSTDFRSGWGQARSTLRVTGARFRRAADGLRLDAVLTVSDLCSACRAVWVGVESEQTALVTDAGVWYPVRAATNLGLIRVRDNQRLQLSPEYPPDVPRQVSLIFPADTPRGRLTLRLVYRFAQGGGQLDNYDDPLQRIFTVQVP